MSAFVNVPGRFGLADDHISMAIAHLAYLRTSYSTSMIPDRKARVRALDAKIDALKAATAGLNPNAHPWVGDWKET